MRLRLIKRILIVGLAVCATVAVWRWLSFAPTLHDGDIIFQTSRSSQSAAVGVASLSLYTHMGIIKHTADGAVVIEAAGPVKETPLKAWIKRGRLGRYTVYRLKGLRDEQAEQVFRAARRLYGRPYDVYFSFDNSAIYCSELVEQAFAAARVRLGQRQRIGDLLMLTGPAKHLLEKRASSDPQCRLEELSKPQCLERINRRLLITPKSISRDHKLEQVFSNYPF